MVICGAGYDDRALRFRQSDVQYFELDLPHVTADKAQRFAAMDADTSQVTLVGIDFTEEDVAEALNRSGQDAQRATLFICEHLLVFLLKPDVVRFLSGLFSRSALGSRLTVSLEVHPDELVTEEVVAANNARFFGETWPPPMPMMLPRGAYLALLQTPGWRVETPEDLNAVFHTDLLGTQFVTATV